MTFKSEIFEPGQMAKAIKAYLANCMKTKNGYRCKCGQPIRQGFIPTFPVDRNGRLLDDEETPRQVPYCERCDPPDGFNHSYARRVFIYES